MNILEELKQRNILNNITNEDKFRQLAKGSGVYIGFDPSTNSLHLGNYIQIAILKQFEKYGYKPIVVLGGATSMIGDPSGKTKERRLLNSQVLMENKKNIKLQLQKYGFKVIDNYDFYKNMNILDFLRSIGKLFNINYMLAKDIVKSRIATGISFTEFAYQLIQGWDFQMLYANYGVYIQVGGSDQWGNITSGIEIIRKIVGDSHKAIGITLELLTTSNGFKFGKTEGNALWLDKKKTSPFALHQYLFNTNDDDVEKLLLWITSYSIGEVAKIMHAHKLNPQKRIAQNKLAYKVVAAIHSKQDAQNAIDITKVLFQNADVKTLTLEQVLQLSNNIPTLFFKKGLIIDFLVSNKIAVSNREAREFINAKAIEINGTKIDDLDFVVKPTLFNKEVSLVKKGKKQFFLIKHK